MAGLRFCLVLGASVDEVHSRHLIGMVVLGSSVACVLVCLQVVVDVVGSCGVVEVV